METTVGRGRYRLTWDGNRLAGLEIWPEKEGVEDAQGYIVFRFARKERPGALGRLLGLRRKLLP